MLHCCFSFAASSSTLLPSLLSSSEQCCVQLFSVAVTRSSLPAFLSSFSFCLFHVFCSQSLLMLLHWLILFTLCCPLLLINFPFSSITSSALEVLSPYTLLRSLPTPVLVLTNSHKQSESCHCHFTAFPPAFILPSS